jgi:hypothetical protein
VYRPPHRPDSRARRAYRAAAATAVSAMAV